MAEMATITKDFLNKVFVDKNVKTLVDEQTIWEQMLTKQPVDSLNVRYYKEQYIDIETPNDSAMSAPIDTNLKSPGYRAPGDLFPHTGFGMPKEYNLGLRQVALEVDVPDESAKYAEMVNLPLKAQQKLANSMASYINNVLGNAISENWTGSTVNTVTASVAWGTYTSSTPIDDILAAEEKIEDISGYNYKVTSMLVSKQTYFDLRAYVAYKNLNYKYTVPVANGATEILQVEGIKVFSTNMVKRAVAILGDFKQCGTLFESEPLTTNKYYTDQDHVTHLQAYRTFNFALTDPKAICLIKSI